MLNHSQQCCWIVENATLSCLIWLFSQVWIFYRRACSERHESFSFLQWWMLRQVCDHLFTQAMMDCFSYLEILYLPLSNKTELNISRPTNWLTLFYLNRWLPHFSYLYFHTLGFIYTSKPVLHNLSCLVVSPEHFLFHNLNLIIWNSVFICRGIATHFNLQFIQ